MSFSLPKACLDVRHEALSGLNIDLVEGSVNSYCFHFPVGFPESFFGHVEVLADSISTGVPESNFFGEREVEGVIREGKGDVEDAEEVATMHSSVELVIGAGDDGYIEVITGVDLVGLVHVSLSVGGMLGEVVLEFSDVYFWHPGIGVDDGEQYFLSGDVVGGEV